LARLELTLACGDYDRMRAIRTGEVKPDGVELNVVTLAPEEVFYRMARFREFDVSELSLSTYTVLRGRGEPLVAIPVFPSFSFRHSSRVLPRLGPRGRSGAVDQHEHAACVGVHVLVDAAGAGHARPAGPQAPSRLDELAFEDEHELRSLMSVEGKPRPRLEADDLHFPAVGDRDVLHVDSGAEARRPPREALRVHAAQGASLEPVRGH